MYISVTLIISCSPLHIHTNTHSIMLYLAAWVYIVSPWEHLKTKKEYRLAERKVMNISPHLVHLRITEERDYAWYRLDSKNTNVLYAKTDDLDFQFGSCHAISSVRENAV